MTFYDWFALCVPMKVWFVIWRIPVICQFIVFSLASFRCIPRASRDILQWRYWGHVVPCVCNGWKPASVAALWWRWVWPWLSYLLPATTFGESPGGGIFYYINFNTFGVLYWYRTLLFSCLSTGCKVYLSHMSGVFKTQQLSRQEGRSSLPLQCV